VTRGIWCSFWPDRWPVRTRIFSKLLWKFVTRLIRSSLNLIRTRLFLSYYEILLCIACSDATFLVRTACIASERISPIWTRYASARAYIYIPEFLYFLLLHACGNKLDITFATNIKIAYKTPISKALYVTHVVAKQSWMNAFSSPNPSFSLWILRLRHFFPPF